MVVPSLFAAVGPLILIQLVACALFATAIFLAAWWTIRVLATEDLQQGAEWRYDVSRINELRRLDVSYRFFQPAIQTLARINRAIFRDNLNDIQRQIQAAGLPRFWLPEEYMARAEIVALLIAPAFVYFFVNAMGSTGLLFVALSYILTVWYLRLRLAKLAALRVLEIKRRMPFLLDLLTLLMEAGSTFLRALSQAVEEFEGHPIAEEFGRVLMDMNLGKTRTEAFLAMRYRLADDEITSIVGSIIQGEQLGTPLAQVFRTQADVLRLKRTQRAEMIAGEAGVKMLMPAVLVMLSTVLVIVGPFLLNYFSFGAEFSL